MPDDRKKSSIVVFGAGGRAGKAIVEESLRRGRSVIGVVRDPARHPGLAALGPGVAVAAGDLTEASSVASVASGEFGGVAAIVNAVTPFTAPPASFDDFDADYYVHLVENLSRVAAAQRRCRVIEIGLFAMLKTGDIRLFQDAAAFPEFLRPFAEARLRGLNAWQDQADVDWLVLTPPPGLSLDAPSTGRYRLEDDVLVPDAAQLSYADLAVAVLDQIDTPTVSHRQTAVYGLA